MKLNLNIALAFNNHIQYHSVIQIIMFSFGDPNVLKAMAEFAPRLYIECVHIHYEGKGEGVGPGILEFFGPCEMASSR